MKSRVAAEPVDDVLFDAGPPRPRGGRARGPARLGEDGELTPRELEVLRLVAEGLSNRAIAERLVISEKTAIGHGSNIFMKPDVHNRAEAIRPALDRSLVA